MPPVFGIVQNNQMPADPGMISRLLLASKYAMQRQILTMDFDGGWLAEAVRIKNSKTGCKEGLLLISVIH